MRLLYGLEFLLLLLLGASHAVAYVSSRTQLQYATATRQPQRQRQPPRIERRHNVDEQPQSCGSGELLASPRSPAYELSLADFEADREETTGTGTASVAVTAFNLAKAIIGAGVMALPAGVGFFSSEKVAVIPAVLVCVLLGTVSAYSFFVIGKVCSQYQASTFREAWERSVGEKGAAFVTAMVAMPCFTSSLAYTIVVGDAFSTLAKACRLPLIMCDRRNVIIFMPAFVLFPLCTLKRLSALTPFSLVGLVGTLFSAAFMLLRLLQGSYAPGGSYYNQIALKPSFATTTVQATAAAAATTAASTATQILSRYRSVVSSPRIFVLIAMLSAAFLAHYNAPVFYQELRNRTRRKFRRAVGFGFGSAVVMLSVIMSAGFLTFGSSSLGFILNNYAQNDIAASIARATIGLSLVTSFPFPFAGMRNNVFAIMRITDSAQREYTMLPFAIAGVSVLAVLALFIKDVSFVTSISGSIFGTSLTYVIPMLMNIARVKKNALKDGKNGLTRSDKTELVFNYAIMAAGVLMAINGLIISVLRQMAVL